MQHSAGEASKKVPAAGGGAGQLGAGSWEAGSWGAGKLGDVELEAGELGSWGAGPYTDTLIGSAPQGNSR
jgi:hypothetical protein